MVLNSEGLPQNQAACCWQLPGDAGIRDLAGGGESEHPHPVAQQQAEEAGALCAASGCCVASSPS